MTKNIQLLNKQGVLLNPYTDSFKNVILVIPTLLSLLLKRAGATILYVGLEEGFIKGHLYKCNKKEITVQLKDVTTFPLYVTATYNGVSNKLYILGAGTDVSHRRWISADTNWIITATSTLYKTTDDGKQIWHTIFQAEYHSDALSGSGIIFFAISDIIETTVTDSSLILNIAPLNLVWVTVMLGDASLYSISCLLPGAINTYTQYSWLDITPDSLYSAFEVMPNKTDIVEDSLDYVTGITYITLVPACTTHKMTLRSAQEPLDCDVVIDWGDGTVDSIKEGNYVSHIVGKSYLLSHDYAENMTADKQRFIVKIYGKNYYTFRHNSYKDNNLISRIFEADLPIASHIYNIASIAIYANRLTSVSFPSYTSPYSDFWNWGSAFSMCNNLQDVTGFEDIRIKDNSNTASIFGNSTSLKSTDFVFNVGVSNMSNVFAGCSLLLRDIAEFFPKEGFTSKLIKVGPVFYKCQSLTGTVPALLLWDNKNITWTDTSQAFEGCSDLIRAQVPTSWGGTASDTIIKKIPSAYIRQIVNESPYTVTDNALWLILTVSDSYIILPAGSTDMYIRISTDYKTLNVTITPAENLTIDGDALGLILDKTSSTVELMWTGTEWVVIEAK